MSDPRIIGWLEHLARGNLTYTPERSDKPDGPAQSIAKLLETIQLRWAAERQQTAFETASNIVSTAAALERERRIFGVLGDGVVLLDRPGKVVRANDAFLKLCGRPENKIVGESFAALVDDGARFTRDVLPELLALRHAEDLPLRIVHQDGSVIEASLTASTVTGFSGEIEEVVIVARDLRESQQNLYLREEIKTQHNFDEIVGESLAIKNVLQAIETVAGTHASVLIAGETGTGKELVARAVHNLSTRKDKPLIKVNSASIPRELFESEFFGHVKGAFTGALKDRVGRFELAHKGTLFLDEVSEIPLEMQSKLLRVLQEGEFERVGEERTRRVDVRIVAATNRDLKREVELGRFRQDLYYRLNVFPIEVAPLRHRTEDISLLASQFVRRAARKLNRPDPNLTQAGVLQLLSYDWPGNVRELQNIIERAMIRCGSGSLQFDLPANNADQPPPSGSPRAAAAETQASVISEDEWKRRERENILTALRRTDWQIYGTQGAAQLLGINPATLASRMKKLGLKRTD